MPPAEFPVAERDFVSATPSAPTNSARWILALLVVYALIRCIFDAATRPFWFDELLTQSVVSQPTLDAMMRSLHRAVDTQGPLFYLLERISSHLLANQEIALRLPGILAFATTLICIFALTRKICGEIGALLCTTLLLLTNVFQTYAVDARAYSLVVACLSFAIICYQKASSLRWTALFALCLALATSLHYYAVFAFSAFASAEIVVLVRARQIRFSVWAALAFGMLPLAVFWPFLSAIRAYYGTHLWKHYTLFSIPANYGFFFLTSATFGIAIAVVAFSGVIGALTLDKTDQAKRTLRAPDAALVITLLALPLIIFVATKILGGSMVDRYTLITIVAISIGIGCALTFVNRNVAFVFGACVLVSLFLHEFSFWRNIARQGLHLESPATSVETFVGDSEQPDLPVVISDGLNYLQLAHYASPSYRHRFIYLTDADEAREHLGNDSVEKGLQALLPFVPLQVESLADFTKSHPEFVVYVEEPGNGFDWLIPTLDSRASLQLIKTDQNRRLYFVQMGRQSDRGDRSK